MNNSNEPIFGDSKLVGEIPKKLLDKIVNAEYRFTIMKLIVSGIGIIGGLILVALKFTSEMTFKYGPIEVTSAWPGIIVFISSLYISSKIKINLVIVNNGNQIISKDTKDAKI